MVIYKVQCITNTEHSSENHLIEISLLLWPWLTTSWWPESPGTSTQPLRRNIRTKPDRPPEGESDSMSITGIILHHYLRKHSNIKPANFIIKYLEKSDNWKRKDSRKKSLNGSNKISKLDSFFYQLTKYHKYYSLFLSTLHSVNWKNIF